MTKIGRPYCVKPGDRFGSLVVVDFHSIRKNLAFFECSCDCGEKRIAAGAKIQKGLISSCKKCGYKRLSEFNKTHGRSTSPGLYPVWNAMIDRCRNKNHLAFHLYGGRGIAVCKRWKSFENFLADMGERPSSDYSIDRIDNNGNYEPGNVRWATQKEQMNNTRKNHFLTYKGETKTIVQWAEEVRIGSRTIHERLRRGWTVENTLSIRPDLGNGKNLKKRGINVKQSAE